MVQSRAVASRLKHVFDMLLEIETILFSGDLSYETFLFPFLLQKFFASYTRQLATFVGRFSRATKVAPCMVAFSLLFSHTQYHIKLLTVLASSSLPHTQCHIKLLTALASSSLPHTQCHIKLLTVLTHFNNPWSHPVGVINKILYSTV